MRLLVRLVALLSCLLYAYGADGTTFKAPYEQIDLSLDFLPNAKNGVTLRQIQVMEGLADVTGTILSSSPAPSVQQSKVIFRVKDGVIRHDYLIVVRIAKIDTSELIQGSILLHILPAQ